MSSKKGKNWENLERKRTGSFSLIQTLNRLNLRSKLLHNSVRRPLTPANCSRSVSITEGGRLRTEWELPVPAPRTWEGSLFIRWCCPLPDTSITSKGTFIRSLFFAPAGTWERKPARSSGAPLGQSIQLLHPVLSEGGASESTASRPVRSSSLSEFGWKIKSQPYVRRLVPPTWD